SSECFKSLGARLEEPGVGHDIADALRPSDDPRLAGRGLQHAKNARVENGDDLGQSRQNRDFSDARDQLAEHEIDAVLAALGLPLDGDGADARTYALSTTSPSSSNCGKTSRS